MPIELTKDMFNIRKYQKFVCKDETLIETLLDEIRGEEFEDIDEIKEFVDERFTDMYDCMMPYFGQLLEWFNNCEDAIEYCDRVLEENKELGNISDMWTLLTVASNYYIQDRINELLDEIEIE